MPWEITAEPERFEEAAAAFAARTVRTAEEVSRTDADLRERSFWVGGGLQLEQIQRVFDSLAQSIDSGEDFASWRKRVRGELRNDEHAATVYRNAVQKAYNAGRYRQMKEPSVVRFRPYFMHDSVLDGRTTATCRGLNGIILPADHAHWKTHWPPGHHRCRRSVRSLRKSEAEKRGIAKAAPELKDSDGWGKAPDDDPVWKPDPKKTDPKLLAELENKKVKADKKPAPKPAKDKPEHDPKHWLAEYKHLGEAAPNAAWGRAMLERGLDRTPTEIIAEVERLKHAGHPAFKSISIPELYKLPKNRAIRNSASAQQYRSLIAFTEHTRTIEPQTKYVAAHGGSAKGTRAVNEAERFYRLSLASKVTTSTAYTTSHGGYHIDIDPKRRSYHTIGERRDDGSIGPRILLDANAPTKTAVHELAHAIEFTDDRAAARSLAFLFARSGSNGDLKTLKRLQELQPDNGYQDDEDAWEDEFWSPYVGKHYASGVTEVTSMGYERLAERLTTFVRNSHRTADEEMLFFLLGQLAGE